MVRNLTKSKKLSFIAGLVVAFVTLTSAATLTVHKAAAAPACDSDAIIYCGISSPGNFISKVRSNDSGNGHHDLKAIYAHYGLSASDYDNFAAHAVSGTAYNDGRIVVDGKVIATGAKNIGRDASVQGPHAFPVGIDGQTYYGNDDGVMYADNEHPVYVLFDNSGTMQFAVEKACGNPAFGNVVHTSASCSVLHESAVSGKLNTYSFTAAATTQGNATINRYVYNFGDGTPTVTKNDGTAPVTHTYTKAGSFTASVTVYASVPGNNDLKLQSVSMCTKVIKVVLPFYNCVALSGAILDKTKYSYSFTAKANYGNGADFVSADFTFGDTKYQNGVKPKGNVVTVTHTYATAGKYNIAAVLHFTVDGKPVTAPTCTASVTPTTPPVSTCKPGVPVGSPACLAPCQPGSSVPPSSPQCQPPELPNTGAGNVVALFGVVAVGGFLVYRHILFRRHKAAFLAAERGSSPLPLGNPLSGTPLAGTPLASAQKKAFRRRRQF